MAETPELRRKIAVIGDRGVGKSTLTTYFVNGKFLKEYNPTIESTYYKRFCFRRMLFNTEIVDTAGTDEYSMLSRNATVGVNGYILVYSIASRSSFEKLKSINDILFNALGDPDDVPRVLIGTMQDLEYQSVTKEMGEELARKWGIPFIETSSKSGVNIAEGFYALLDVMERDNPNWTQNSVDSGCTVS